MTKKKVNYGFSDEPNEDVVQEFVEDAPAEQTSITYIQTASMTRKASYCSVKKELAITQKDLVIVITPCKSKEQAQKLALKW
jgi:hypothetical protein